MFIIQIAEEIDIKLLPEEARKILVDFYIFLVEKYSKKGKIEETTSGKEALVEDLLPKKIPKFVPLKREEVYGR